MLLDTHVFLWMQAAPERLGGQRELLQDEQIELYLSAASSWEIAIKWQLGKLTLPEPPARYVPSRMQVSAINGLAVEHAHTLAVAELPPHHRDPIDRLLIAQSRLEGLTIATSDEALRAYDVDLLWIE